MMTSTMLPSTCLIGLEQAGGERLPPRMAASIAACRVLSTSADCTYPNRHASGGPLSFEGWLLSLRPQSMYCRAMCLVRLRAAGLFIVPQVAHLQTTDGL